MKVNIDEWQVESSVLETKRGYVPKIAVRYRGKDVMIIKHEPQKYSSAVKTADRYCNSVANSVRDGRIDYLLEGIEFEPKQLPLIGWRPRFKK